MVLPMLIAEDIGHAKSKTNQKVYLANYGE